MLRNTILQLLAVLALGALLGYGAASGKLNPFQRADASSAPPQPAAEKLDGRPADAPAGVCCDDSANRKDLLVMAGSHAPATAAEAQKDGKKPNILVIFGDDIGQSNISAYTHGLMGYRTPNIDRIAR